MGSQQRPERVHTLGDLLAIPERAAAAVRAMRDVCRRILAAIVSRTILRRVDVKV
jgi:hypothetical protein